MEYACDFKSMLLFPNNVIFMDLAPFVHLLEHVITHCPRVLMFRLCSKSHTNVCFHLIV